ncbi:MAG: B12-binding domain-containing radical SAM protein [Planctomycetes bacterium]|nr:B12-binding domain-containing radical SAM protein [Planctomycetota bacterium]
MTQLVQLSLPYEPKRNGVMDFTPLPPGSRVKLMLVYPNLQRVRTPQLGVAVLSASAKRIGADVCLFDTTALKRGTELDAFKAAVEIEKPDILGYSVRSSEWPLTLPMLEWAKSQGITQVIGGPHPTHAPEETIPHCDAIVLGEGEGTLMDILRAVADKRSLAGIANTWVITDAGVVKTAKRDLIHDLDDVPLPDWKIFADIHFRDSYIAGIMGKVNVVAAIEGSRGCPFTCTYCSNHALMDSYSGQGRWRREKSPERIVEELAAFREAFGSLDFVYWVDEIWLTGVDRLKHFRDLYKPKIGVPFSIMERPECITQEKMEIIADAGLHYVAIGLESGDEELRTSLLDRRTKLDVLVEAFTLPKKYNVKVHAFTMLGLPGQDVTSMLKTWTVMRKILPTSAQFSIFYPLKGTKLYDQTIQMGMYDPTDTADNYYSGTVLTQDGIDNALLHRYQTLLGRYANQPGWLAGVAFHFYRIVVPAFKLRFVVAPAGALKLRYYANRWAKLRRKGTGAIAKRLLRAIVDTPSALLASLRTADA